MIYGTDRLTDRHTLLIPELATSWQLKRQRERERETVRVRHYLNFSEFKAFVRFGEVFKLSQAFYLAYLEQDQRSTAPPLVSVIQLVH